MQVMEQAYPFIAVAANIFLINHPCQLRQQTLPQRTWQGTKFGIVRQ